MTPRATYRIQFHADFPFAAAEQIAPYLRDLGISHLYASPIAAARAGSNHGYDVIDPTRINPELGGEEGFRRLAATLKVHGIGIILDIVPNHMAVGGANNAWWLDVLENGPDSAYAGFFDIDWTPSDPELRGRLLAPFLGMSLDDALREGAIRLVRDDRGTAVLAHDTHRFPIRRTDCEALDRLDDGEFERLHDPATDEGRERFAKLLSRQHYRLAWWRTAADRINWRRFFDITELAGLCVEETVVFDAVHALPLRLYAEGLIDGVRVDHVDGLADPPGYCHRLRAALSGAEASRPADASPGPAWLIVEKILGAGEALDPSWQTDGTSGYDFMDRVSALQHDADGTALLDAHWQRLSGRPTHFDDEERAARLEILERTFPGQWDATAAAFHGLTRDGDVTTGMVRRGVAALLTEMRVYRTYGNADTTGSPAFDRACEAARANTAPGEGFVIDLLRDWIVGSGPRDASRREAVQRFEQLSAPLSAKAVEDTAFYRYARLLSRTDVGFSPETFSLSPQAFLDGIIRRAADHPHAMLTTATHDHKRGEDVRARLAVLSETPAEWIAASEPWMEHRAGAPLAPADRYAILQTIVGAWATDLAPHDANSLSEYAARVADWSRKAMREAKLRSSWAEPDEAYEQAGTDYIAALVQPDIAVEIATFVARIAPAGAVNGIVQALLRSTLPGVPDLYQGAEFWDLSLVDPDNRRPVDYAARQSAGGTSDWRSGRVKQAVIAHALNLRREAPELFTDGRLVPLQVTGARADNIVAFAREKGGKRLIVALPLKCFGGAVAKNGLHIDSVWSGDTAVIDPDGNPIPLADIFAQQPYLLRMTG